MIFDNLKNKERYRDLPWLYRVLEMAPGFSDPALAPGAHPIDENARAVLSAYNTSKNDPARFENHRDFIDVQFIVEGKERIGVAAREKCTVKTPYSAEKDCEFLSVPEKDVTVLHAGAGDFAVLFPGEAHAPGASDGTDENVRKIVFKVRA